MLTQLEAVTKERDGLVVRTKELANRVATLEASDRSIRATQAQRAATAERTTAALNTKLIVATHRVAELAKAVQELEAEVKKVRSAHSSVWQAQRSAAARARTTRTP